MISDEFWNGITHLKVDWDGTILDSLNKNKEKLKNYNEETMQRQTPQDDWQVVTVDYHD